jgi:hypothetical protein
VIKIFRIPFLCSLTEVYIHTPIDFTMKINRVMSSMTTSQKAATSKTGTEMLKWDCFKIISDLF